MHKKCRFTLAVRPSIFKDGTFGVYAIPEDSPKLEYQLDGCFPTIDDARAVSDAYLKLGADRLVPSSIDISESRDIRLSEAGTGQTEENQVQALKTQVKKLLADLPNSISLKPFLTILFKITESTPYSLAIIAAVVFKFSLSVTVPKALPLLGEIKGGSTLGKPEVAHLLPFVLLASTIILQILARVRGLVNSAMRDNILGLTLRHGWRRERFARLYLEVIEAEGWGSLRKFGEWFWRWNPDTLRQVYEDAVKLGGSEHSEEVKENLLRLSNEDFEARIHALYSMEWEPSFTPFRMAVNPLLFILGQKRAVRRGKMLMSNDVRGYLSLSLVGLPGWEESRTTRRVFWGGILWEVICLGGPTVWAFVLSPWSGVLGRLGMFLMVPAILAPIIVWNYGLFVRSRGIPSGMSWIDINDGKRLIRAL